MSKEQAIKKMAEKIGILQARVKELEEQIEFLENRPVKALIVNKKDKE